MKAIEKEILRNNPALAEERATIGFCLGLYQRDAEAADQVLATVDENWVFDRGRGDTAAFVFRWLGRPNEGRLRPRRAMISSQRAPIRKIFHDEPEFGPALCALGLIDAQLGRCTDALQEGRRALEPMPLEKMHSMVRAFFIVSR